MAQGRNDNPAIIAVASAYSLLKRKKQNSFTKEFEKQRLDLFQLVREVMNGTKRYPTSWLSLEIDNAVMHTTRSFSPRRDAVFQTPFLVKRSKAVLGYIGLSTGVAIAVQLYSEYV